MATARVDERDDTGSPSAAGASAVGPDRPRTWRTWAGLLAGLVAVLTALSLPFAPVRMSTPEVSWPQVPGQPVSTMLELTSQEPVTLDVAFTCATARAAAATGSGFVLSTVRPESARAQAEGLLISARDGDLRIAAMDEVLLQEPLRDGDCSYALHADGAGLTVSRDGVVVGEASAEQLPGVDVLATSLTALSAADGEDLSVRIGVDDQFSTSPTALKTALSLLCLLAALLSLLWLWGEGTGPARRRAVRGRSWGPLTWVRRLVDVLVVAVVLLWTLITPMTGDDGYYAAMARNSPLEGYVGNYYQLLNQSFTPFTWFYRLLGWWDQWVGPAPALLRVPALVAGLLTYAMAARLVATVPAVGQRARTLVHGLLAVVFLVWWLPYDMGLRPEAMVAAAGMGALLAVLTAVRRDSLGWAGVAVLVAAVGFVCHPTGFVALAPLLAGLPRLTRLVRSGRALHTLTRVVCLVGPGAVAGVIAFSDGSLRDFLRGQEIFLAAQAQENWTDEIARYGLLLGDGFMGAYAKRLPVLLTILALGGWLLLAAALRGRGRPLPLVLHLSAVSFGLSLLLLWLTPSKWSFHFGSLAGVGAVFLTLLLAGLPRLVRQATPGRSPSPVVALCAGAAGVIAVALSFVGPNSWPSSWMLGVPQADVPPRPWGVPLGSPAGWLLLLGLLTGALWLVQRRRARRADPARPGATWRTGVLRALPLMVVAALLVDAGYLVGSFGFAAVRPQASWSPWGDTLRDPFAEDCHASSGFQVLDDAGARPLTELPGGGAPAADPAEPAAFAAGGWYGGVPPASTAGPIWGSLQAPAFNTATGSFTTGWYELPTVDESRGVVLTAAGNLGAGNTLVAEYGRSGSDGVEVLHSEVPDDGVDSPFWRSLQLDPSASAEAQAEADAEAGPAAGAAAPGAEADVVRLVASDGTTEGGGWLAFSAPSLQDWVPVQQLLGGAGPVGVAWQIALLFPCQRQPRVQSGITEPVDSGVLYGGSPIGALGDATWLVDRGGIYAPVLREASVTALPTRLPGASRVQDVHVFRFENPYPDDGYRLDRATTTVSGWSPPPGWGDRPAR